MAEQVPNAEIKEIPWRVVLVLGALGMYGELDESKLTTLPFEMDFVGLLGDDRLRVIADEQTTNYYVDWELKAMMEESAVTEAVRRTIAGLESLHFTMDGIALRGARVTDDEHLFDRFPHIAWADMDDYTELAQERIT